jgi:hypothetical protein
MERVGHKLGYHMKDASGKYAPVVKVIPKDFSRREQGESNGPSAGLSGSSFPLMEHQSVLQRLWRKWGSMWAMDPASVVPREMR